MAGRPHGRAGWRRRALAAASSGGLAAGALAAGALAAGGPTPALAQSPGLEAAGVPALLAPGLAAGFALLAAGLAVWLWRAQSRLIQYGRMFDAIPWARQLVDGQGRPQRTNRAFVEAFGSADRTMPDALMARVRDDSAREEVRRLAATAANGIAGHVEVPLAVGGQDAPHWLDVRAQPLVDGTALTLWMAEDITARRHMQDVLQSEQARFVDLLEHAPVGFYSVDGEGRFRFVNATLAEWLDTKPERLTDGGLRLHDVAPQAAEQGAPPYAPFPQPAGDGADAGGAHSPQEIALVGPTGQRFQAYVTQEVVASEGGRDLATRSVVRNLSRERQVRDQLERSERRFRRFFEEAPVGIALLDAAGCVQECNPAFAKLMAVEPDRVAGRPAAELVHANDRDSLQRALEAAGDGPEAQPEVHAAADPQVVCRAFATPLDAADGRAGHVVHLIDTTEQKKLEEQFAQSQKMQAVGQLAGGIAHDFNNLLTAMIGFCDLLLLRHRPGDQSFADLMQIKQNANRAANLVRQLLAFSRQQTLRPSVLSVTDVLQELMHLLRRLIGEQIHLDVVHGRELWEVKVDQGQLEQVIINLAVNARDAMAETGGELTIRTSNRKLSQPIKREGETVPPGDYVLIEVADTGCGISQENLDRIFEPFFSTKEMGAGTGLGLSTVYGIVKQTGGFILVDSVAGEGATFRIYLPRYVQAATAAAAGRAGQAQVKDLTGAGTLLLVEDEDAVRSFSARALRKKGYDVLEANSGESALELMEQSGESVDLLITDVVMPNVDGPTLVKRVRESHPGVKVIFISGYTEDSFRKHLGQEADVHFLGKPFTLKQLAGAVKDVLHEGAA